MSIGYFKTGTGYSGFQDYSVSMEEPKCVFYFNLLLISTGGEASCHLIYKLFYCMVGLKYYTSYLLYPLLTKISFFNFFYIFFFLSFFY